MGFIRERAETSTTVILDVDGTLVDTNYQHAIAWHRALREHGYAVAMWRIHRHIGMGGDQLVASLIGDEGERADGDRIRAAEGQAYAELIGEVQAMTGATELLRELREDGAKAILASSAKVEEVGERPVRPIRWSRSRTPWRPSMPIRSSSRCRGWASPHGSIRTCQGTQKHVSGCL